MELSNKSLALLLVAAIIVSVGGTLISLNRLNEGLTGFASAPGKLNLSISSAPGCRVDSNISFGTATQPTSDFNLSSDSDNTARGYNNCTDSAASAACKGLQINNTGNTFLNISFNSSVNATGLLNRTYVNSVFIFYTQNGSAATNSSAGCLNTTGLVLQNNVTTFDNFICRNLSYVDGSDVMHIEFNVSLYTDTPPGEKTAYITITCDEAYFG